MMMQYHMSCIVNMLIILRMISDNPREAGDDRYLVLQPAVIYPVTADSAADTG